MSYAKKTLIKAVYDFAVDGGAISSITLADNTVVPIGSIITGVYTKCITPVNSGGSATLAVVVGGLTLIPATAFTHNAFDTAAQVSDVQALLGSDLGGTTTTATGVTVNVAVAATTAGKLEIFVEYIGS